MADILAAVGEDLPLTLVINDGNENLYPQAKIFDEAGSTTPVATLNLEHVSDGYYRSSATFTIPSAEKFTVVYTIYEDAGRTNENTEYVRGEDKIIADIATAIPQSELEGFPF